VRSQGAQVNGLHAGSQTSFTVDAPGAIAASDVVAVDATSAPTRSVISIAATNVTVGGAGFLDVADDSRLSVLTPKPTIYNDSIGNETKPNPLTTDINGLVECWVLGGMYDLLVTALGTSTLYTDVATVGGESMRSNIYGGAGFVRGWNFDTLRSLDTGDAVFRVAEAGTARFTIFKGGGFTSGGTNASTISGPLTVNGLLTLAVGISGDIITTSDIKGRRIYGDRGTALVVGDFSLSSGWGDTATVSLNDPGNEFDTRCMVAVTANGSGIGTNPTLTVTWKNGAFSDKPRVVAMRTNSTAPSTAFWVSNPSATQGVFDFIGTPVAGSVYGLVWITVG
jgi:hypothetical protein